MIWKIHNTWRKFYKNNTPLLLQSTFLPTGAVTTILELDANNGFLNNLIYKTAYHLAHLLRQSPDHGAVNNVYLATSPEVYHITGKFFDKKNARNVQQFIHIHLNEDNNSGTIACASASHFYLIDQFLSFSSISLVVFNIIDIR